MSFFNVTHLIVNEHKVANIEDVSRENEDQLERKHVSEIS